MFSFKSFSVYLKGKVCLKLNTDCRDLLGSHLNHNQVCEKEQLNPASSKCPFQGASLSLVSNLFTILFSLSAWLNKHHVCMVWNCKALSCSICPKHRSRQILLDKEMYSSGMSCSRIRMAKEELSLPRALLHLFPVGRPKPALFPRSPMA